mgnify:CR=1 FL=1
MLKNVIKILLSLLLISILYSCYEDSLGIEDNIRVTLIDTVNKKNDTDKKNVKITAKIDIPQFYEMIFLEGETSPRSNIFYIPNAIKKNVLVDTSKNEPFVWLELALENQVTDLEYLNIGRKQYIQSIRIKVDSLESNGYYLLSGEITSGLWAEVIVNDIEKNCKYIFNSGDANLSVDFYLIRKGYIEVKINTKVPLNPERKDKIFLMGSIDIFY